jgi:hypothetical protein
MSEPRVWPIPGRRVYPNERGHLVLAEGDYGKDLAGEWWCRPPGCSMGSLKDHEITEHEDGTVTVTPSIEADPVAVGKPPPAFHGYLQHGVWRKA